jgi:hypothetical protein
MSIAADCFVPDRTAKKRLPLCPAFLSFGWLLDGAADRAAVRFFALIIIGISLGSIAARLLLHHRSPAEALTPAGRDPGATKAHPGNKHSNAPITSKCQLFLDNLVAQIERV